MGEAGFVTEQRAERARRAEIDLSARRRGILRQARSPFFVEFIKQRILDDPTFGKGRQARIRLLFQGGLEIHTTLAPRLQRHGRRAIDRHLSLKGDPESAIVALRPGNGAIRALIGGRNFRDQKFNLASQGRRQPGSAFKPFTLVTALEQGFSPLRTYDSSSPKTLANPGSEPWEVHNASQRGYGEIDLRAATRNSVNVVYAQLIQDVGPRHVVRTARRMGIETELPAVPSLTLGTAPVTPLEMASAYSTLANRGKHCEPFAIRRIVDRGGDVIFRNRRDCKRAVGAGVAARAVSMLQEVIEQGTGTAANIPWPAFGKTGTTDDYGDAWFVGCTIQVCASTWVGHMEGRIPMRNVHGIRVFGGTFPARIWHDFMTEAMDGRPAKTFPEPPPMRQPQERRVPVPTVGGLRVGEARAILQDAGFDVVVTFEDVRNRKRAREVVAQRPRGGREAIEGATVRLTALRHASSASG
jgi:penicillin-binding protein 1A